MTPKKRKAESEEPPNPEKEKFDIMKKYYRSRHATFLKALMEQKKKKELELEEIKKIEEKKKAKLKEDLGMVNVQSRFKED